ncbi:hypothetical protein M758_6G190600 [Ceratodon purpureus]|nr:hypothetical protein M758_6G190600 [Ceratodon purpureus]
MLSYTSSKTIDGDAEIPAEKDQSNSRCRILEIPAFLTQTPSGATATQVFSSELNPKSCKTCAIPASNSDSLQNPARSSSGHAHLHASDRRFTSSGTNHLNSRQTYIIKTEKNNENTSCHIIK